VVWKVTDVQGSTFEVREQMPISCQPSAISKNDPDPQKLTVDR
jgi:hypothetical protein